MLAPRPYSSRWHTGIDGSWLGLPAYHRAGADDASGADNRPIEDRYVSTYPNIVLDHDALRGDPLPGDGDVGSREDMVPGHYHAMGGDANVVADLETRRGAVEDGVGLDAAPLTDAD